MGGGERARDCAVFTLSLIPCFTSLWRHWLPWSYFGFTPPLVRSGLNVKSLVWLTAHWLLSHAVNIRTVWKGHILSWSKSGQLLWLQWNYTSLFQLRNWLKSLLGVYLKSCQETQSSDYQSVRNTPVHILVQIYVVQKLTPGSTSRGWILDLNEETPDFKVESRW